VIDASRSLVLGGLHSVVVAGPWSKLGLTLSLLVTWI